MSLVPIGATEPIALRLTSSGAAVSGAGVYAYVVRDSDGYRYDWTTHTFAPYATVIAGTPTVDLLADASDPNYYVHAWDMSQITNPKAGGDLYITPIIVTSPFDAQGGGSIDTRLASHGDTTWATAAGFATSTALATLQTAVTGIGSTLASGVNLAAGALTSTVIGSGFVAAVTSGLSTAAALATVAADALVARQRLTNRRAVAANGTETLYADDGTTVLKTRVYTDVTGGAVTINAGEPARASVES